MPHEIPEYMSADYVKDKTSVDILWSQLRTLQDIAQEFGIDNIFQDNGAEILQQLIYLNMKAVPGREGNDGVDEKGCEWEMKSLDISKGNQGITTNHHLNASIIEKYRTVPWSISIYDGIHLKKIYVVGNEQLQSLFAKWEEQLQTVESINNPKIPLSYIEENGVLIYQEGDEYPTNPMTVINTTPYIPVQRAYFRKIDCQNEVDKLEKELAQSRKSLEKARRAADEANATLSEKNASLSAGSDDPKELKKLQKAVELAQKKVDKATEKVTACLAVVSSNENAVTQARNALNAAVTQFQTALAQFLEDSI